MEKYRMLSKKGEGTFSEVLKCVNIRDGTNWACKKMKQRYQSTEEVKSIREIQALRNLRNNPYILQLKEVIFERKSGTLNLIFELMDMNLYELIRTQKTYFTEDKSASFVLQLLKAVEHMHKHGYFHRDIKPENILVKGDLLKLADFGSVRKISTAHPYTEYISTRWYRAPECLLTDGFYSFPMDIWSIGCVMFEILTLQPLFPGSNEIDQIDKIHDILGTPDPSLLEKFRLQSRNIRYAFKPKKGVGLFRYMVNFPRDAVELISILCTYDPERRISAHRALKHSYFDSIKEQLENANKENDSIRQANSPDTDTGSGERQSKMSSSEPSSVLDIRPDVNLNNNNNTNMVNVNVNTNQQQLQQQQQQQHHGIASNEFFKPILKRKLNLKNLAQLNPISGRTNNNLIGTGTSLSALNQTNQQSNNNNVGPTSFSVLSNYSDNTANQLLAGASSGVSTTNNNNSATHNNNMKSTHLSNRYPLKKSYLTFGQAPSSHAAAQHHLTLPKLNPSSQFQYMMGPTQLAANSHHQSSPTMHSLFAQMGAKMGTSSNVLPEIYPTSGHFIESKLIGGSGSRLHSKY